MRLLEHTAYYGGAVDGPVPFDGATTLRRPTTLAHWLKLGFPKPSTDYLCDEASGNLVDAVRGAIMTPSGAVTYRQAGTGAYASVGVGTTEVAAQGFSAAAGELWDQTYQETLIYSEHEIRVAPGGGVNRALLALTGAASLYVACFLSGAEVRLQARSGSVVSGTTNHAGARFGMWTRYKSGSGVLNHTGSGVFTVQTNLATITGVYSDVSDATKGIGTGGSGSITPANAVCFRKTTWHGSRAAAITIATALTALGW